MVCVKGDGSIAMNMQELEVIARYQLPVKIFVSDNAGYSMIYGSQNGNFHRLTGCNKESGLTLPNMENIAKAFGIKAMSILNEENLKEKIYPVINELNLNFRWCTFVINTDNELIVKMDAILDMDTCGEECKELIYRTVGICDEAYPTIMNAFLA